MHTHFQLHAHRIPHRSLYRLGLLNKFFIKPVQQLENSQSVLTKRNHCIANEFIYKLNFQISRVIPEQIAWMAHKFNSKHFPALLRRSFSIKRTGNIDITYNLMLKQMFKRMEMEH